MSISRKNARRAFSNNPNTGDYIDFEGVRMHYLEKGAGRPVLLVHGIGQSLYTWHKNIDALAESFHVFAPDLLGYGYSDKPDIGYTVSDHADMLQAFMDSMEIEKADLIAFGTGGVFALDFMIRHPERAGKAVLISPGGLTKNHPFFVRMLEHPLMSRVFIGMLNRASIRNILEDAFFDQTFVSEHMVEEYARPLLTGEAKSVLARSIRAYDDAGVMQNIRMVEHKVLLYWGEDDGWHVPLMANLFHSGLRNSSVRTIRNCGHLLHEEKSARFNEETIAFLNES